MTQQFRSLGVPLSLILQRAAREPAHICLRRFASRKFGRPELSF